MNENQEKIAQLMYENYNFGEGVIVIGSNNWETDNSQDYLRVVYVEFNDEPSESSHKISFHVKFKDKNSVELEDVYGLLVSNGAEIGTWTQPSLKSLKPKI